MDLDEKRGDATTEPPTDVIRVIPTAVPPPRISSEGGSPAEGGAPRAFLGLLIVAAGLVSLMPKLLGVWVVLVLALGALVAPALRSVGALEADAWPTVLMLGAALCLVVAGGAIAASHRWRRWPRSLLARVGLWLHAMVALSAVVALLVGLGVDSMDGSPVASAIVAAPGLVVIAWGLVVLPLLLVVLGVATLRWAHRALGRTTYRAGLASGLLVSLIVVEGATWGEEDPFDQAYPPEVYAFLNHLSEKETEAFDGWTGGSLDEGRRWLLVLAAVGGDAPDHALVASAGPPLGLWKVRGPLSEARLEDCFTQLGIAAAVNSDRRNVDIAVAWLVKSRRYTVDDAKDLAQATMLRVCEKVAAGDVDGDIGPYFMRAVMGNDRSEWRKLSLRGTCSLSPAALEQATDRRFSLSSLDEGSIDLTRILCGLDERERDLLEMLVLGMTSKEIAAATYTTDDAIRQRIARLRTELRRRLEWQR